MRKDYLTVKVGAMGRCFPTLTTRWISGVFVPWTLRPREGDLRVGSSPRYGGAGFSPGKWLLCQPELCFQGDFAGDLRQRAFRRREWPAGDARHRQKIPQD